MENFPTSLFSFAVSTLLYFVSADTITDYCSKDICLYQGTHIRCNNDGSFSKNCVGQYNLVDMTPYQPQILNVHNTYRNRAAGGELDCYYPATGMNVLDYDNDLAENAEYNAKTCVFAHDKCRATSKCPYAGQNIYYTKTKNMNKTTEEFIDDAIYLWFVEFLDGDHKLIETFDKTDPQTGHFTVLVSDRQYHVGCAMLNNPQDGKRVILFICNYTSTNFKNREVYRAGKSASECLKKSSKYPNLCETKSATKS